MVNNIYISLECVNRESEAFSLGCLLFVFQFVEEKEKYRDEAKTKDHQLFLLNSTR